MVQQQTDLAISKMICNKVVYYGNVVDYYPINCREPLKPKTPKGRESRNKIFGWHMVKEKAEIRS